MTEIGMNSTERMRSTGKTLQEGFAMAFSGDNVDFGVFGAILCIGVVDWLTVGVLRL